MKETNQDRKIMDWIQNKYGNACRTEKRHADKFSEVGLPDINIVVYGMSIQIEDKIKGEFPRDNQILRLLEYKTAGAISFYVDSFEMFLEKWDELVEKDERFIFMKNNWNNKDNINWSLEFIDYKNELLKDKNKK